ncbi:MAG: hypothetical protein N4A64_09525 [Marinisporobacter sp.]|jgi:hypothetical protein|nr:hypothetical protein [Marinisporobacter sp.]
MTKNTKNIFSSAWVVNILCSIIATIIISAATALYKQINLLEALKLLFKTLLTWISTILTFKVPVYIILLVIVFLIIAIESYSKFFATKEDNLPKWLKYTRTHYKNWVLKWEYHLGYGNKFNITNIHPICECGCELSAKQQYGNTYYGGGIFICPKCENTYPPLENSTLDDFRKILIHDINTENYPQNL